MKIISVVGARPNFMKVAPLHRAFSKIEYIEHKILHTGQHYDEKMSDAFFRDLQLPMPNFFLGIGSGSHAVQTAKIMIEFEKVCIEEKPDLVLVVGDVNSTIASAITAKKLGIKVAHVEAGLRSFDREMPEELNRIITDSISDFAFITEQSGIDNLLKENFPKDNIFFCGNTMIDSLVFALETAKKSKVLEEYNLNKDNYALITMHRPSNVDDRNQLIDILEVFRWIAEKDIILLPMHPRTKKNIERFGLQAKLLHSNIIVTEPKGYIDFLALMKNAKYVLTDSGGIQEETTYLKIPCFTMRTSTERPSTIEIGSNILVKPKKDNLIGILSQFYSGKLSKQIDIPEKWDGNAAERIVKVIIEKLQP